MDFKIENCRFKDFDKKAVEEIFKKLEFHSLINKIPTLVNDQ